MKRSLDSTLLGTRKVAAGDMILSFAVRDLERGIRKGSFAIEGEWYFSDLPEVRQELDGVLAELSAAKHSMDGGGVVEFIVGGRDVNIINGLAERSVPYIRREVHLLADDLDALEDIWEKAFPGVCWDGSALQLCILYNKVRQGGVDKACTKFYQQRLMELVGGLPRLL